MPAEAGRWELARFFTSLVSVTFLLSRSGVTEETAVELYGPPPKMISIEIWSQENYQKKALK